MTPRRASLALAVMLLAAAAIGAVIASANGDPWETPEGADSPPESPLQELPLPPIDELEHLDPLHCTMNFGLSDPTKYAIICSAPWIDGCDGNLWPAPGQSGGHSQVNCNSGTGSDHRTCNQLHEWHPDQCPAPEGPPNYTPPGWEPPNPVTPTGGNPAPTSGAPSPTGGPSIIDAVVPAWPAAANPTSPSAAGFWSY